MTNHWSNQRSISGDRTLNSQARGQKNKADDPTEDLICLCNIVTRGTIEEAIRNGADTLNKIFDATTAGVGPCGGSCRRKIQPMLDQFQKDGTFPTREQIPGRLPGQGKRR